MMHSKGRSGQRSSFGIRSELTEYVGILQLIWIRLNENSEAKESLDQKIMGLETDLDRPIFIDNITGSQIATMRQIVKIVKRTYCDTFALQYMHISDPEQSAWLGRE